MKAPVDVVTGAFSNTGRYVARLLQARGRTVRTLTGHPERAPAGTAVEAHPYSFERPEELVRALKGADTLYNGYWVRFDHGGMTYEKAVENTRILVQAAVKAGMRKIVQISIANSSADSPFRYYKGKAALEDVVRRSGLEYAILKPTVIFGGDDILINNIAYLLRRFPLFMIPGDGRYGIQPVHVQDLADLMVANAGPGRVELDAVGPEVFEYGDMVRKIAAAIGRPARLVHVPRGAAVAAAKALSPALGDVLLTPEEVDGLMAGVLVSRGPATCATRLTDWLAGQAGELGRRYISELATHFDKEPVHG